MIGSSAVGNGGIGGGGSVGEASAVIDAAAAADRVGVRLALVGLQSRAAQALGSSLAGGPAAPAAAAAAEAPPRPRED